MENKNQQNQNKITDLKSVIKRVKGGWGAESTIAQFLYAFLSLNCICFLWICSLWTFLQALGGNAANLTVSFAPRNGSCIVILDFINQSRLFEGPTCLLQLMCVDPCLYLQRGRWKLNYITLISNCINMHRNQFTTMFKCNFEFKIVDIHI